LVIEEVIRTMRAAEIMKSEVECVTPNQSAQEAARMMRDENIGFLPVCDESQQVLGTLTDRDIAIRLVADGSAASTPVEQLMSTDVVACSPDDELERVEELMSQHHKSRILIVDESGRLQGVISLSDILQEEIEGGARTLKEVSEREAHPQE
jgi:CBS domain-containing protein